jgi:ornithine cyclodeaminase/alanine dehydrogenase-like protein (mu-crystallin family)
MALFIDEATVRELLTMPIAVEEVERSFEARARGAAFDIPRRRTRMPGGHLHILQAGAPELNLVGYKAYYIQPDKSRTTLVHLINREQGYLEAVIESDALSQIRTGAATGVAAKVLARPDAQVLGLFGAGRHAVTQLQGICAVRKVKEVRVFARNKERLQAFCDTMAKDVGTLVRPATSAEEAVRGCDMVVTMTRSGEPVFDGRWVEPGQFIAATGANALDRREIDLATVRRADVLVVDSREVAQGESGDLLAAYENGLLYWENIADLGEVLVGRRPGRTDAQQVTLFESHGMALQDIYTGARVLAMARTLGRGIQLPY